MINYKHQIELKDGSTVLLSGKEYFNDKRVFWNHHQTQLESLCQNVYNTGFPITIKDLEFNIDIKISTNIEFDEWLNKNQPFKYENNKIIHKRHHNIPAAYLILLQENKILLLRRFNTGYKDGQYSFIAGHVDPGETFTQCIIREAKEEAGIVLEEKDMEVAHVMHRNAEPSETNERIDIFFTAKNWKGEIINKEPHKCDELAWFEIDNLPKNIIPYIKQVIDEIKSKNYYSEYGWE